MPPKLTALPKHEVIAIRGEVHPVLGQVEIQGSRRHGVGADEQRASAVYKVNALADGLQRPAIGKVDMDAFVRAVRAHWDVAGSLHAGHRTGSQEPGGP